MNSLLNTGASIAHFAVKYPDASISIWAAFWAVSTVFMYSVSNLGTSILYFMQMVFGTFIGLPILLILLAIKFSKDLLPLLVGGLTKVFRLMAKDVLNTIDKIKTLMEKLGKVLKKLSPGGGKGASKRLKASAYEELHEILGELGAVAPESADYIETVREAAETTVASGGKHLGASEDDISRLNEAYMELAQHLDIVHQGLGLNLEEGA